jgi:radical SAM protein with 4Fe4S-binding SPASM domain
VQLPAEDPFGESERVGVIGMVSRTSVNHLISWLCRSIPCPPGFRQFVEKLARRVQWNYFCEQLRRCPGCRDIRETLKAEIGATYIRFLFRMPTAVEIAQHLGHFYQRFPGPAECRQALARESIRTYLGIRPFNLEMDITNQCNLRCLMCYFSDPKIYKRKREDISVEDFARIAKQVFPLCQRVSLSIATEPLLHQQFDELLAITRRYEVPLVYMNTNGVLLNEKRIDRIIRSGMHQISISIDAATKQTYERIRVGSDFDRLLSNIRALNEAKRLVGSRHPHLNFNFVLMRSNVHELPALIQLAHRLGVRSVAATHVVPYENTNTKEESLEGHKELCDRMLDEARALAKGYRIGANLPEKFGAPNRASLRQIGQKVFSLNLADRDVHGCCQFPWHFIAIDCDGRVHPCGWWYSPEQPMGDIKTESFEAIWNNERYRALRAEHLSGALRATCRTCPAAGMGRVTEKAAFQVKNVAAGH